MWTGPRPGSALLAQLQAKSRQVRGETPPSPAPPLCDPLGHPRRPRVGWDGVGWGVPGRRYGTQSVSCRQGARGRCCPGAASYRQEEEGPARRGGAPAGRGWVGKAASQARPPAPPLPSSLPALPGSGLPSRLRRALPEAALAPVSPCPSRARSPPPPRGLGALPATPRR